MPHEFKVGDIVEVDNDVLYSITKIGSIGKILEIHNKEACIDFEGCPIVLENKSILDGTTFYIRLEYIKLKDKKIKLFRRL